MSATYVRSREKISGMITIVK